MRLNPPAIPFARQSQAKKKKNKTKTLKLQLDPRQENSPTYEYKIKLFSDGTPEEWLKFLMDFEETVCFQYPVQTFDSKLLVLRTLLDGQTKELFDAAIRAVPQVPQEDGQMGPADHEVLYKSAVDAINEVLFDPYGGVNHALRRQHSYRRCDLYFEKKQGSVDAFKARLKELNKNKQKLIAIMPERIQSVCNGITPLATKCY